MSIDFLNILPELFIKNADTFYMKMGLGLAFCHITPYFHL